MEILVFKTNIHKKEDIQKVGNIFSEFKDILTWNVDTEDVDKVLRIEAHQDITRKVEHLINSAGYHCEEMI